LAAQLYGSRIGHCTKPSTLAVIKSETLCMFQHKTYLLILFVALIGCNSEYKVLEKYYRTTPELHKEVSDGLIELCKKYKTSVTLHRSINGPQYYYISFFDKFSSTSYSVVYDSLLIRSDPSPNQTRNFEIPINIMNSFRQLTYARVKSDSTNTFFGGPWHVKAQLGTQADSQYGILISNKRKSCEQCYKELAPNTWLTEGVIP
jgi:hypothetical protein